MASKRDSQNAKRYRDNACAGLTMYDFLYIKLTKFIHQALGLFRCFDSIFSPPAIPLEKIGFWKPNPKAANLIRSTPLAFGYQIAFYGIRA